MDVTIAKREFVPARAYAARGRRSVSHLGVSVARPGRLPDSDWLFIAQELDLSPRQVEIVRCIVDGLNETEAAQRLGISRHTVHAHVNRLFRKVGVKSRCDLIVLALFCVIDERLERSDTKRATSQGKRAAS